MDYKDKLIKWNSTEKYHKELDFLKQLMPLSRVLWTRTLDYGCGLGYAAYNMCADGYDVNDYKHKDIDIDYYLTELPNKEYGYIYMMHSFSHLPNPKDVLRILRSKYPGAIITVITPNKDWLDEGYNNDPTVVRHYTMNELKTIFEDCGYEVNLIGQFGELKNNINERIFLQTK